MLIRAVRLVASTLTVFVRELDWLKVFTYVSERGTHMLRLCRDADVSRLVALS